MEIHIQPVLPTSRDRSIVMLNIKFNDNARALSRCSAARCLLSIANPQLLSSAASCVSVLLIFLQNIYLASCCSELHFHDCSEDDAHVLDASSWSKYLACRRKWVAACMSQRVFCIFFSVAQHNINLPTHERTISSG